MGDNGGNSIEKAFGAEQHAIQRAWERCTKAIQSCDRATIIASFSEFDSRLRRLIRREEKGLFPAIMHETTRLENDPTIAMRAEHCRIEEALDRLRARVDAGDCAALYGQHLEPSGLFRNHLDIEKKLLYPLADLIIPAEKCAEILSGSD